MTNDTGAPTRKVWGPVIMALTFWLVFFVALVQALGFRVQARLGPLAILVPALLLTTTQVIVAFRMASNPVVKPEQTEANKSEPPTPRQAYGIVDQPETPIVRQEWIALSWVVILGALVLIIGFLPAVPVFMLLFLRIYGQESWRLSLLLTGGTWLALYLFFVRLLHAEVFEGFLWIWLH